MQRKIIKFKELKMGLRRGLKRGLKRWIKKGLKEDFGIEYLS